MRPMLTMLAVALALLGCTAAGDPPGPPPSTDEPAAAEVPAGMSRDEAIRRGLITGDHLAIVDHAFGRDGAHHLQVRNLGRLDATFGLRLEPADGGMVEPTELELAADGGTATVVVEAQGPVDLVIDDRSASEDEAPGELARLTLPPPDT